MANNKKINTDLGFPFSGSGNKGLTLIELLVAVAILAFAMIATVGIFTASVRGQTKNLAYQELFNQTGYVIEYTGRALRMAKKDVLGDCVGTFYLNYLKTEGGKGIRFLNYRNKCQEFRLNVATDRFQERESDDNTSLNFGSWVDLTSDNIEMVSFNIGPDSSWDQNDFEQSRVTLFFKVMGASDRFKSAEQPIITAQTTVSQRNLDVLE